MAKKTEPLKSITELAVMNPSLKESLAKFEGVKQQLETVAKQCLLIKVTDETSLSVCESNLTKLNDLCKVVETVRVKQASPYWDKFKAINEAAAYVSEQPEAALTHLKDQKKDYILKVEAEKKRKEALQAKVDAMAEYMKTNYESIDDVVKLDAFVERINKIDFKASYQDFEVQAKEIANNYLKLFSLKKTELEALLTATPDEVEAIKEASAELVATIEEKAIEVKVEASVQSFGVPKKVRRPWKFEVVDATKVPKEWLMIDEEKVNEWKKANQDNLVDGQIINGIKFYKDLTITA